MIQLFKVTGNEDTIRVPTNALEVLNWTPAKLTPSERMLLFTLIYSLRPERYLEIGTLKGGSAMLVAAAMDAADYPGRIVCVDKSPQVSPEIWDRLKSRASMVVGDAKDVLPEAQRIAGAPFDFIFIDGDHREDPVVRDATKAAAVLAPGGYMLFHDSFYGEVARAVDRFVLRKPGSWLDLGNVTREYTVVVQKDGSEEPWCGFRLVKHRPGSSLGRVAARGKAIARAARRLIKT
jgi:predicted O-methyltransferase YrrM